MARSLVVAALLLALVASTAAQTFEPTAPTAAPTSPTAAPTSPTEAPTSPTAAPTSPTAAPTSPTAAPTTPTAAPTTPTAAPTTPTAAPTTPTAAPTTPSAAPTTPSAAPTTPTAAPTSPTPGPTPAPLPATCSSKAQYRAPGGCSNCVSKNNPSTHTYGKVTCVDPTTQSSLSTNCSPFTLPAFIRSNIDKASTVSCINPEKRLVTLFLVTKNSNVPFLSSAAYIKTSLRLAGQIPAVKLSNGNVKFIKFRFNNRILVQFNDKFGVLSTIKATAVKAGVRRPKIALTGVLTRGEGLLNQCFKAILHIC